MFYYYICYLFYFYSWGIFWAFIFFFLFTFPILVQQAYHEQWEEGRVAREARERQEHALRVERNKSNKDYLNSQIARQEAEKIKDEKVKEQEQILRVYFLFAVFVLTLDHNMLFIFLNT